jgi:hypothetical protein
MKAATSAREMRPGTGLRAVIARVEPGAGGPYDW